MAEFLAWLEEPELVTAFHSSFASLPLAEVLELHWLALLQLLQLEGYCSEERFVHMCVELCGRYLDSMCKAGGGGGVGGFPDSAMDFALESIAGVLSVACATRAYRGAKTSVFAAAVAGAGLGAAPAVRGGDKAKKKRSTTTTTSTPVKDKDGQAVPAATAAATSSSSSSSSSSSPSTAPATTSVVLRCSVANICAAPLLRVRKTLRASVRAIRERRDELGERRGADGAASAAVAAADNNGGGGGGYDDDDESVERERALLARDQELACVVAACLWENASVGAALVPLKSATEWLAGTEAAAGGDAVSDWSSLYLGLVFVRCALLNAERLLLKVSTPCPLHIPLHALCASYTLPSPHPSSRPLCFLHPALSTSLFTPSVLLTPCLLHTLSTHFPSLPTAQMDMTAASVPAPPADDGVSAKETKIKAGASTASTSSTTASGSGKVSKLPPVHPLESVATSGVLRHVCWLLVHRCALVRGVATAALGVCLESAVSSESAVRASKLASQQVAREQARQAGMVGGPGRNTSRRDSRRASSAAVVAATPPVPAQGATAGSSFAVSFLQVRTDPNKPSSDANIDHPMLSSLLLPHSSLLF